MEGVGADININILSLDVQQELGLSLQHILSEWEIYREKKFLLSINY